MLRFAILAGLIVAGCRRDKQSPPEAKPPEVPVEACEGKGRKEGPITWFEDDWSGALACAKQRKSPIVLDLWAPWCHTCISMQTTVFMDPSFAAKADQFVWVSLDADRSINEQAVGKYAPSAMPTFYVIGPDEQVLSRFVGAATVQQFHDFLDAGARAAAGGIAAADARLQAAERALAAHDAKTADVELTAALAAAPADWPRRPEAAAALQLAKKTRDDIRGCIEVSDANLDKVGATATATNFWAAALECASDPSAGVDPAKAKSVQERAIAALAKTVDDAAAPLSIDDRAEALAYLRDAQDATRQTDAAKATAEKLRALLDDAWAKAPTPFERMTYLWPRAEVYVWMQRPLEVVADFEKLAAELPTEYDPPARLGWVYLQAGNYDAAAKWTDKALALVYGPRKARLLGQRAEIAKATGDSATERAMREQVVALWESMPPGQQNANSLANAKAALDALNARTR